MKTSYDEEKNRGLFQGPLCVYGAAYLALLEKRGYKRPTVYPDTLLMADLDGWMERHGEKVVDLKEAVVDRFLAYHMSGRRAQLTAKKATLSRLLAMLRETGIIAPAEERLSNPAERWVDEFGQYLVHERGFAATTIAGYGGAVCKFLSASFGSGRIDLTALSPATVVEFIRQHIREHSRVQAQYVTTALRSFFRFLSYRGVIAVDLAAAVPRVAAWALASLPKHLPAGQVRRVLGRHDRTTACGRRDYAILLLLARLGLRSCEVADLRLDDLEWDHARIGVRSRKSGRSVYLPLAGDVGRAIVCYLKKGRPRCACREVFVRNRAPLVGVTRIAIGHVARQALIRAGIEGVCLGAHTFRHTLATDLLRRGASLDEIGRILRHRDASTTAIYAKVDLGALRPLAMRWPGGAR